MSRTPRDLETRDAQSRTQVWQPPNLLPAPHPREGWEHRYVRISMRGQADPVNYSYRLREGYEPCKSEDYPELTSALDPSAKTSGNVEIGGLLLCRIPIELAQQRAKHYSDLADRQLEAADRNFMREQDPRMPLLPIERKSRTRFGRGARED